MKIAYNGKLAIFTSFYSHYAYAPYVISLAQTLGVLSAFGVKHEYLARPSDFHIERAINNTLTELIERDDFTDVLLIDSDESWEPEAVIRLLLNPEEIIAGSYRMKNKWTDYVGTIRSDENGVPIGKVMADGKPLLEAERVAAGFLRIKISALRKFAEAYPELRSKEPDGEKVQFFSRALIDGEMACQDMMFSKRWLDIGGTLWIDPNLKIGHWGMECHDGDLDAHLKGKNETQKAFAVIKQMAERIKAA
jgi:hypothetical protein